MRRSPLVLNPTPEQLRTGSTLARSTAPIARTAINAVSPKRKAANAVRRRVLAEMRQESDGICPICRDEPAVDGHELLARSANGSITDKANIRLIGRTCHMWITHDVEGQRWAYETGWRISRYERSN